MFNIPLWTDNLKMFDRAWEETLVALEKAPQADQTEGCYHGQLEKVDSHGECFGTIPCGSGSRKRAQALPKVESTGHTFRNISNKKFSWLMKKKGRVEDDPSSTKDLGDGMNVDSRRCRPTGSRARGADCAFKHDDQKGGKRKGDKTTENAECAKPSTAFFQTKGQHLDRNMPFSARRSTSWFHLQERELSDRQQMGLLASSVLRISQKRSTQSRRHMCPF